MEIYLVGGAVRDRLLGREPRELDWVVVGATVDEMHALGYRQVGRDFPVFLHPETGEEYALARTERRTGAGHRGFDVHAGRDVTLEEDLRRRDLTVNAMAEAADGRLVDPYGGRVDLEMKRLRHVSEAFAEDPLRVFRVARLAAQLPEFEVAPETIALMADMTERGRLVELSAERVWTELEKALGAEAPGRFFHVLRRARSLSPWFAELETHAIEVPVALASTEQRYAAVLCRLEPRACRVLGERLKAPRRYLSLAQACASHGDVLVRWQREPADVVHRALVALRAFKPETSFARALEVLEAAHGVGLRELSDLVERVSAAVDAAAFARDGLSGRRLGDALARARIAIIAATQH